MAKNVVPSPAVLIQSYPDFLPDMIVTGKQPLWTIFLLLIFLPLVSLEAQEPSAVLEEQILAWENTEADGGLGETPRLQALTGLLFDTAGNAGWSDPQVWSWCERILEGWKASPDLEIARQSYLEILNRVGQNLSSRNAPFPGEEQLREYLRQGLGLAGTAQMEATLYLYLAESWLRTAIENPEYLRRAASILNQSTVVYEGGVPLDAVHAHLGNLYYLKGDQIGGSGSDENLGGSLTEAVFHFRSVLKIPGARSEYAQLAEAALSELLIPELKFTTKNRFLPQSEVRLPVETRNLREISVEVYRLPVPEGDAPMSEARMRSLLKEYEPLPEDILLSKRFPIRTRALNDWNESEMRLGDAIPAGWFGIRVRGGILEAQDLLLITALEMVVIPRPSGALQLWVSDVETGLPAAGAEVHFFNDQGGLVSRHTCDPQGLLVVPPSEIEGWEEVQAHSGQYSGFLKARDSGLVSEPPPWVIANTPELRPGETLQWALFGLDPSTQAEKPRIFKFHLPGKVVLESPAGEINGPWLGGAIQIPETLAASGPVYFEMPSGFRILLAHVRLDQRFPVQIDFSGERLGTGANLFLNTSPVGVLIRPDSSRPLDLPGYIRLRISKLQRESGISAAFSTVGTIEEAEFETILSLDDLTSGSSYFELPEPAELQTLQAYRVEILPLDTDELLAVGHVVLSPYRTLVRFSLDNPILRPGEQATVHYEIESPFGSSRRPVDGELVVYRETWESRYIHRRRGTLISEFEYRDLPDRSLLGSAKTDYRLAEEGFVREELQRIPLNSRAEKATIGMDLELPGYYNIEYEDREADTGAVYENDSLELWVLPASGDLPSFRSEQPRLILGKESPGPMEILVLLNRAGTSIFLDLEHEDGTSESFVFRPESSSLAFTYTTSNPSPVRICRVVIVGERSTDFLWERNVSEPSMKWELQSSRLFGLNPHTEFSWPLALSNPTDSEFLLWTFVPEVDSLLFRHQISWQKKFREKIYSKIPDGAYYLDQTLPLLHPFSMRIPAEVVPGEAAPVYSPVGPTEIISLFPEIRASPEPAQETVPLHSTRIDQGSKTAILDGTFPESAGRWYLTTFFPSRTGPLWEQWLLSTELPIRSSLSGPEFIRSGDRALMAFQLENTTRTPTTLEFDIETTGPLLLDQTRFDPVRLDPSGKSILQIPLVGLNEGSGRLRIKASGSGTSSEALKDLRVTGPPASTEFKFTQVTPQSGLNSFTQPLDGWVSGELKIASGLGSLLPPLWTQMRQRNAEREPMLVALGDWALGRTIQHHGISGRRQREGSEERIVGLLIDRWTDEGGFSWTPGRATDPWLTALTVWTIDTFHEPKDSPLDELSEQARSYLESVLVSESSGVEDKLFALRALSARALHEVDARLSRIQARSFLEFFRMEPDLSILECALLLQVADAYRFREEVQLLAGALEQRLQSDTFADRANFHALSSAYLALANRETSALSPARLVELSLHALEVTGPRRSWEQIAGFLNLLSRFYWQGEFNIDGQIEVRIEEDEPFEILLGSDYGEEGAWARPLRESTMQNGAINIQVDTTFALSPVYLVLIGQTPSGQLAKPLLEVQRNLYREYLEPTLLAGTQKRLAELDSPPEGLQAGDVMQMRLAFEFSDPAAYAEIEIPVPAGLALRKGTVAYLFDASGNATEDSDPVPQPGFSEITLNRNDSLLLRLQPFPAGRHVLSLSFDVNSAGSFSWPEGSIIIPRTGQVHGIPTPGRLKIEPARK